jgi:hypothetical protein
LSNYVVLRNGEDLFANLSRGGDLDLLVADVQLAERTLVRHLGLPVRISRSSYVTGYSYDWGHVDLEPTIEWRGASYVSAEAVLQNRRLSTSDWPAPRIAHEALIAWFASLLWGGFFKERYASVIGRAVKDDGEAFRQALVDAAGRKWGERLWRAAVDGRPEASEQWAGPLRRAVWWRAFSKSPLRTVARYLAFARGQIKLRFDPSVPCIAILGGDDDMRSSVVKELVARFAGCPYVALQTVDWRRPIGSNRGVEEANSTRKRNPLAAEGRQIARSASWLVSYWTRWVHLRAKGYIVAVGETPSREGFDSIRDHLEPSRPSTRALAGIYLPAPDFVFVLDPASGERKDPAGDIVDQIQTAVRAWMARRAAADLDSMQVSWEPDPSTSSEFSAGVRSGEAHRQGTVTAP